jgi:hypothetical protein
MTINRLSLVAAFSLILCGPAWADAPKISDRLLSQYALKKPDPKPGPGNPGCSWGGCACVPGGTCELVRKDNKGVVKEFSLTREQIGRVQKQSQ